MKKIIRYFVLEIAIFAIEEINQAPESWALTFS